MTFRSNDKLDGTGFRAAYKFIGPDKIKNHTQYVELDVKNSCSKIKISILFLFVVNFVKHFK